MSGKHKRKKIKRAVELATKVLIGIAALLTAIASLISALK